MGKYSFLILYFFIIAVQQPQASNERVTVNTIQRTGISDACNSSVTIPELEFHVLVKQGKAAAT